jgi:thioredoxin 1
MVAKSGGRLILTAEQFEREVLHLSSSSASSASSSISQQHHHSSASSVSDNNVAAGLHTVKGGDHINHNTSSDHSNNNSNDIDILPVLVLFTAPWCGPCRLTSPVVTEIMTQYANKIHVLEISTDDLPDVAISVGVRSIPTILLYHEGIVQDIIVGCVAKNVLAHAVDKMLEELDKKKSIKH